MITDEVVQIALQAYLDESGSLKTNDGDMLPMDDDAMRAALEAVEPMLRVPGDLRAKLRGLSENLYSHTSDDSDYQNGVIAGYEEAALALDSILDAAAPKPDKEGTMLDGAVDTAMRSANGVEVKS